LYGIEHPFTKDGWMDGWLGFYGIFSTRIHTETKNKSKWQIITYENGCLAYVIQQLG